MGCTPESNLPLAKMILSTSMLLARPGKPSRRGPAAKGELVPSRRRCLSLSIRLLFKGGSGTP